MSWEWSAEQKAALIAFLRSQGMEFGEISLRQIGDGHSNLTYLVSDGRREVVVRRGPPPPVPVGAHDMLREAKLMAALVNSDVPVPRVLATCAAGAVIDVAFYVMSYIRGEIITTKTPAVFASGEQRRQIAASMIDALVKLHQVDWEAAGLADMGRPENFNKRHLDRMARLVADDQGRPPAGFADVDEWLHEFAPAESGAAIVHNDFRIGNLMFGSNPPARVAAVLDWELATIGDPLFDVGYFLSSVPVQGEPLTPTQELSVALTEDGYPSREEMARSYAQLSGRDFSSLNWYTTLALWKLAVLYEYGRRRVSEGRGDTYYENPAKVESFLAAARRAAGLPRRS